MKDMIKQNALEDIAQRDLEIDNIYSITHWDEKPLNFKLAEVRQVLESAYDAGLERGLHHHPRYTRIDIEGERHHYAVFNRKPGTNWINVEVMTPEVEIESAVPADNPTEQKIAAKAIYRELQECHCNDIGLDRYMQPFRHLAGYTPEKGGQDV